MFAQRATKTAEQLAEHLARLREQLEREANSGNHDVPDQPCESLRKSLIVPDGTSQRQAILVHHQRRHHSYLKAIHLS